MKADEIAARRVKVAAAILEHKTQRAVAAELQVNVATVNSDIKAIRREWAAARVAALDEAASEDLARLNTIEATLWTKALTGDLQAVDRWIKVRQERAKLLGIDSPAKYDLSFVRKLAEEEGLDIEDVIAEASRIMGLLDASA